jgi:cell division protein FtsB
VTVNLRTAAKVQLASQEFSTMKSDVDTLRNLNQSLKSQIERLQSDPLTIETAARSRLNMVRSNEFVVPVE